VPLIPHQGLVQQLGHVLIRGEQHLQAVLTKYQAH
jgi:hypothetical protein